MSEDANLLICDGNMVVEDIATVEGKPGKDSLLPIHIAHTYFAVFHMEFHHASIPLKNLL